MLEVHAAVTQALDAEMRAEHGLTLSAYEVLMFLADAPGGKMRMSEIADRVPGSAPDVAARFFVMDADAGSTRAPCRVIGVVEVTRCSSGG